MFSSREDRGFSRVQMDVYIHAVYREWAGKTELRFEVLDDDSIYEVEHEYREEMAFDLEHLDPSNIDLPIQEGDIFRIKGDAQFNFYSTWTDCGWEYDYDLEWSSNITVEKVNDYD